MTRGQLILVILVAAVVSVVAVVAINTYHEEVEGAKIVLSENTIDLSNPKVLENEVKEHSGEGIANVVICNDTLLINGKKVTLFLSEKQMIENRENWPQAHELKEELKNKPVLNASVLDYLLDHPELIPESWKNVRRVFFWGTIYEGELKHKGSTLSRILRVRYLYWRNGQWGWSFHNFGLDMDILGDGSPAAVVDIKKAA